MKNQTRLYTIFISLLVSLFFLNSCSSDLEKTTTSTNSTQQTNANTSSESPYPIHTPETDLSQASYPSPTTNKEIITDIPTPVGETATVTGVIQQGQTSSLAPADNLILALAKVVPDSNGNPIIVSFNRSSAPKTVTDSKGRFVFVDIPPGQYGLILDRIIGSYLLNDPENGGDMLITTEPGQLFDLGTLLYTSLPGYQE